VREFFDDIGINLHGKGRIIEDTGFFWVGGVQDTRKTISEIRDFFNSEDTSNLKPDSGALGTLKAFGITYENGSFAVEEWSESQYSALDAYVSPFEHSEEKIYEILSIAFSQIQDAPKKIVLSHVPPYEPGIVSSLPIGLSTGSNAVTEFILDHNLNLSLSGHYHRHHEFQVGKTNCIVVPAVTNGFYGVLTSSTSSDELQTEMRKF
ncbi:MAG: metallophosphoesterase, partial [Candidatus Thorarchaeota archaeon]